MRSAGPESSARLHRPPTPNSREAASGPPSAEAFSSITSNKSSEQLSIEERGLFRSIYAISNETDEPPYPINGLEAIFDPIIKIQSRALMVGTFRGELAIDREGHAVSISVLQTASVEMSQLVALATLKVAFKLGVGRNALRIELSAHHQFQFDAVIATSSAARRKRR